MVPGVLLLILLTSCSGTALVERRAGADERAQTIVVQDTFGFG